MGWAKFDDQFTDHPKVVAAGPMAELLAMRAVIHCARYETDGHVQAAQLPRLAVGITSVKKRVAKLVEVGLWHEDPDGDGWWVHDYLDYNPSAEEQEQKRADARERMRRVREKKRRRSPERSRHVRANSERSSPNPVPVPPVPDGTDTSGGAPAGPAPPAKTLVDEHIAACPDRPPTDVIGQVGRHVARLLDEQIPPDDIRGALTLLRTKGLHPSTLPSLVEEHRAGRRRDDVDVVDLAERRLAGARSRGASLAAGGEDRPAALKLIGLEFHEPELAAAAVEAFDAARQAQEAG